MLVAALGARSLSSDFYLVFFGTAEDSLGFDYEGNIGKEEILGLGFRKMALPCRASNGQFVSRSLLLTYLPLV
jgi:hypothetical protein